MTRAPGSPSKTANASSTASIAGTNRARAGADGGAGLGLALVAEHLRVHGGTVRVADPPDAVGTRVVMEVPWLDG